MIASHVSSSDAWRALYKLAKEQVCLCVADDFMGISSFYAHFEQVSDEEVLYYLLKQEV